MKLNSVTQIKGNCFPAFLLLIAITAAEMVVLRTSPALWFYIVWCLILKKMYYPPLSIFAHLNNVCTSIFKWLSHLHMLFYCNLLNKHKIEMHHQPISNSASCFCVDISWGNRKIFYIYNTAVSNPCFNRSFKMQSKN